MAAGPAPADLAGAENLAQELANVLLPSEQAQDESARFGNSPDFGLGPGGKLGLCTKFVDDLKACLPQPKTGPNPGVRAQFAP